MGDKIFQIEAPLAGTFYRRPSPDEDIYVEVDDRVKKGDVVCIVETMKIFNEIRTEHNGIIREILIEDEDPVMIHQPMFKVEAI